MIDTKIKNPLRDPSLYMALIPLLVALAPQSVRDWVQQNPESVAPIIAYLVANHWLRGKSVFAHSFNASMNPTSETNPPTGYEGPDGS